MKWVLRPVPDPSADAPAPDAGQRRKRWPKLLAALLFLLVLILAAAWMQRRTIARDFIDRELARRGVPARYEIVQLSPWRQRLTQVVIGDPARPDLIADWIELRTAIAPWKLGVLAVRAGGVRMRARVVDGRLRLGAIDRLMPPPSGKPFALPHLIVDVRDARMLVDTPAGRLQIAGDAHGMLDDGLRAALRVRARRLAASGCVVEALAASLTVRVADARPSIDGPVSAAGLACGDAAIAAPQLRVNAALGAALERWQGRATLSAALFEQPAMRVARPQAVLDFRGDAAATRGAVRLAGGAFAIEAGRGAALGAQGDYSWQRGTLRFLGEARARDAALAPGLVGRVTGAAEAAGGTPLAPLAARGAAAVAAAARAFDAEAAIELVHSANGLSLALPRLAVRAASGARLRFDRGRGVHIAPGAGVRAQGQLRVEGGGLPSIDATFASAGATLRGTGTLQPYAAGGARLALSEVAFAITGDAGRFAAEAVLSGPLAGGRVEELRLPLRARWAGTSLALNPDCFGIGVARLEMAGLRLGATRLPVCPLDGAALRIAGGRIGGGLVARNVDLSGRLGESTLHASAARAELRMATQRFVLADAALRLGGEGTRLELARLEGSPGEGGRFSGLAAELAAVPLRVSEGAGRWRVDSAGPSLSARIRLTDRAESPRFHPLVSEDVVLRLADGAIVGSGTLQTPQGATPVATVRIAHRLATGSGSAAIAVPGLAFAQQGLQPSDLTPLTYGVVADVDGRVSGEARIDWTPEGVASSGTFGTDGLDLAAAFGPVRGLATRLRFTDLLAMQTAPGQTATVAEVNPGVPARDGRVVFQLLGPQQIAVAGAHWPFAGGDLNLAQTLLDFSERGERRLTFHVTGADAALFLKEMEFDNLDATGTFDGTLPMVFDAAGGRIEGGTLTARGGGSIAYVGEVSQRDLGFWGNMAFQALRSLDYRSLSLDMNGSIAGNLITDIRFEGISQGKGARSNFLVRRLAKLPLVFNVRVSAPFRQLLDSVQSWYDPSLLVQRNLPALLEEQERAEKGVQQGESADAQEKER